MIGDHLGDPVSVHVDRDGSLGGVDDKLQTGVHHLRAEALCSRSHHLAEIHRSGFQRESALRGTRECREVLCQPPEPAYFMTDLTEFLGSLGENSVDHALDRAFDDRQWRPHLVGDLAEEPNAAGFGLLQGLTEAVDVSSQRGELCHLGGLDALAVLALGHPAGRRLHRTQRRQQPAGSEQCQRHRGEGADHEPKQQGPVH